MNGVDVILAERIRQIAEEGYDLEHDYVYEPGTLALAAACYAHHFRGTGVAPYPQFWPWDPKLWKLSDDPMRNLAKAGALIAAEIDCHIKRRLREMPSIYPRARVAEGEAGEVRVTRAELVALQRSHDDLDRHCQELDAESESLKNQLDELRTTAGVLVDHLADAWWVEAGDAFRKLQQLATGE